jgi:hypothetical protein
MYIILLYESKPNDNRKIHKNKDTIIPLSHITYYYALPSCNYFRTVLIPNDARIIKQSYYLSWSSLELVNIDDKNILSNKYPIYSINTIKKFNLEITSEYITELCDQGLVDILEWIKNKKGIVDYSELALDLASANGHVHVLEWWYKSGLTLKYTDKALYWASNNGHVDVLEWWKKSGLTLEYTSDILDIIYNTVNDINLIMKSLEWWLKSGLELKYTERSLSFTYSVYYNISQKIYLLEWWVKSDLPLKYSENLLDLISQCCCVEILEWWINNNLPFKYTENALTFNCGSSSDKEIVKALNWWVKSNLPLKYTEQSLHLLTTYGYIESLEWWKNSGLTLKYDSQRILTVLNEICYTGYFPYMVRWWNQFGITYIIYSNPSFKMF